VILAWLLKNWRLVAYAVAILAVIALVGLFSHSRYAAGEAAGRAHVQALWDAATEAQRKAVVEAEAKAAKTEADQRAAAQEVENGLREQVAAADAAGRTLSQRVRDYEASLARCRSLPGTPPGTAQPEGTGGESGRDAAFERLSDDAWAACKRDALRLDRIDQWAAKVGLQKVP